MNVFSKRFFVLIALIYLGFTAISFELKNLIFFPAFLTLLAAIYLILSKRKIKIKNLKLVCCLLIFASIFGILSPRIQIFKNEKMQEDYSGEHKIKGYISEVSSSYSFMSEYVMHVESLDNKNVNFDIVLVSNYQCELTRGDFFELTGEISSLVDYGDLQYLKNKNEYDYPLICAIDDETEINYLEDEFRIILMLSDLNSKWSSTLKAILGKENGSLASALLLGNRELLSDNTLRDFKRAGVYHMLALSGLHVAILIGILDWILKKLYLPRSVRICVSTFLSLFYVALTGFALSAIRSVIMLWIMYLALTLGKKKDAMTSLFVAVTLIVLINPSSILDVGLQLSFLSTFGVIASNIICEKIRWFKKDIGEGALGFVLKTVRKLCMIMLASLCVFIFTLPVIMKCFGEVSLATFVSNIFMGVICEMFMIFSLLALILSFNPNLCFPFAEISIRIGDLMTDVVLYISDMEGVMLSLSHPYTEILVWGLFFGFLFFFAIRTSRKWLIFVPVILFAVLLPINIAIYSASRDDFVRAEYIAGDSLVFSSADEIYICDMSDGSYGIMYESVEIAKENCFTEIDGIILTHYHSKHVVSLERLAKNYKIHSVLLPTPQNSDEDLIMRSLVRVLSAEQVDVYIYENDRSLDILSGKLNVSPRAYTAGYAQPSVAISFAFGSERITLLSRPYFDTYLEKSGMFEGYIKDSEYVIYGADGRDPQGNYEIFTMLQNGCEISFSDFDLMNKSDFEDYLNDYQIYFDVEYKKYDLK